MNGNNHPVLEALTEPAEKAIGGPQLALDKFPYRFGRECRGGKKNHWVQNRRAFLMKPNNDIYMWDVGYKIQISREHFLINLMDEDTYEVLDRGSRCGICVNEIRLGPDGRSDSCLINNGDTLVVGVAESPYQYTFIQP